MYIFAPRQTQTFMPLAKQQTHRSRSSAKKHNPSPPVWYRQQKYLVLLLVLIPLAVYFRTLFFGYTQLDDTIFIVENQAFNQDPGNIPVSFQRGLFNPENDAYYRPVFLVDFILESRLFGIEAMGYHVSNLLFHILCVVLLYIFLRKLQTGETAALLLSLIFAVHPVISQAVAWIPGRNDMLLMIFFLSCLILCMQYAKDPGWLPFTGQFLLLLMALFTKETAVMIPPLSFLLLFLVCQAPPKRWLPLAGSWITAVVIWAAARWAAAVQSPGQSLWELIGNGIERSPALLQYLGKIVFPVNLAVFPSIHNITLIWGFMALGLLGFLVIYTKAYQHAITLIGFLWFILFLIPVLIVPPSLNDQVFEHRLYLPLAGILLIISQTTRFGGKLKIFTSLLILVFSIMTFVHITHFSSPPAFWTRAVADSPGSAYAHLMLGLRMTGIQERSNEFEKAWQLNPDEKMLNYLMGKMALEEGQVDKAEMHFKRETGHMQIPDNYFCLARIYFETNRLDSAAWCLERVIELDPLHPQANPNLVSIYNQLNRPGDAQRIRQGMHLKGMTIPPGL